MNLERSVGKHSLKERESHQWTDQELLAAWNQQKALQKENV